MHLLAEGVGRTKAGGRETKPVIEALTSGPASSYERQSPRAGISLEGAEYPNGIREITK